MTSLSIRGSFMAFVGVVFSAYTMVSRMHSEIDDNAHHFCGCCCRRSEGAAGVKVNWVAETLFLQVLAICRALDGTV